MTDPAYRASPYEHEPPAATRYTDGVAVMMVAAPDAPDRLPAAIAAMGGRIVGRVDWEEPLPPHTTAEVVAAEADGAGDRALEKLPALAIFADANDAALVVAMADPQIDPVAAALLGSGATLLVDPDVAACAAALALAPEMRRAPAGVSDAGREGDTARLERLNAEVARIAETLARLTRGEDREPSAIVGDRTNRYGAPPSGARGEATAADVRRIIRRRRLRDQFFGPGLFEDPGWDMLLDLFAAELERTQVSVSSLCIAAAVAPTTALRWIARMTEIGLFERHPDPHDRRRAFMKLSPRASEAMRGYMLAAKRAELAIE